MSPYLEILRPHQWIKNAFLFLPLFFGKKMTDGTGLVATLILFVGFTLIAGSVYIFNDLLDAENDKKHPRKKFRPIASGKISSFNAIRWFVCVAGIGWGTLLLFLPTPEILGLVLFYFVMNLAYSFALKKIELVDVMLIAAGFVIRIFLGGVAGQVDISEWIVVMTFLLAVFLAIAKRRGDYLALSNQEKRLEQLELYNSLLNISAAVVIVAYIIYSLAPETTERFGKQTYLTSLFIVLGVFRYLQLVYKGKETESPTLVLLKDVFLQTVIVLWIATFYAFAYR